MIKWWRHYRFLISRRICQIAVIVLFLGANLWGWTILKGNLSSALVLDVIPLTDPFAALQMLATGFVMGVDAWIGVAIIIIFYGIIAGRAFCGWVCPMNMVTDTANWFRKKLKFEDLGRQVGLKRYLRYLILLTALILSFAFGLTAFELISPVSMLHRGLIFGMGLGWLAILAIFLFDLFILKNGFCGYLCPLGGMYSIIGRLNLIRVKYDNEKCSGCMDCIKICPEKQVLPMITKWTGPVLSGECTNCGRCIEVCEDEALKFGMRFYNKSASKQFDC